MLKIVYVLILVFNLNLLAKASETTNIEKTQTSRKRKQVNILKDEGYIIDVPTKIAQNFSKKLKSAATDVDCFPMEILVKNKEQSIFKYDTLIRDNMTFIKENLSPFCTDRFIEHYLAHKYTKNDPLLNEFCQTNDCELIKRAKELFEENINELIQDSYGESALEYSCHNSLNYGSDFSQIVELLKNIKDAKKNITDAKMCNSLQVGETKVVEDHDITGVQMRYALKRKSKNELQANIVIKFQTPDLNANETPESMMKKAKKCLAITSSYFTSPSGETIRVNILDPDEAKSIPENERPLVNSIGIGEPRMRSHSRKYASDIDCPTITHEVLHLMGLCDEYKETIKGYYVNTETGEIVKINNDLGRDEEESSEDNSNTNIEFQNFYSQCRAISKTPSIMRFPWEAMQTSTTTKQVCKCKEGMEESCKKITNNRKLLNLTFRDPFFIYRFRDICTYVVEDGPEVSESNIEESSIKDFLDREPVKSLTKDNKLEIKIIGLWASELDEIIGQIRVHTYTCQCNSNSPSDCEKNLKILKNQAPDELYPVRSTCPFPIFELDVDDPGLISREDAKNRSPTLELKVDQAQVQIIRPPVNPKASLLHPAHFTRIKYGSCPNKAKIYSMCAKYAYIGFAKDCPDRPKMCEEEEKWLLSDQ
jgi:hypothetical protein